MTDSELVDLGKVLAALTRMQGELTDLRSTMGNLENTVAIQTSQIATLNTTNQHLATEVMQLRAIVERLPCSSSDHDTNPEVLNSIRPKMCSVSEDEPDSVVTRQMDLRASKSGIEVKGPSIMVVALGVVAATGVAAWIWFRAWLRHKFGG